MSILMVMTQSTRSQPQHLTTEPNAGFTLIEKLIIVSVIGVLGAITAPNFHSLLMRMKVEQAVVEVRGALEETQQQAIRDNKICDVTLDLKEDQIEGDCLISGTRTIPEEVDIATNLIDLASTGEESGETEISTVTDMNSGMGITQGDGPTQIAQAPTTIEDAEKPKAGIVIHIISGGGGKEKPCKKKDAKNGKCSFPIQFGALGNSEFDVATNEYSGMPADSTGKIVFFVPKYPKVQRKCVVISNTLGLTRVGNYSGSIDPAEITDSGVCQAAGMEEQ